MPRLLAAGLTLLLATAASAAALRFDHTGAVLLETGAAPQVPQRSVQGLEQREAEQLRQQQSSQPHSRVEDRWGIRPVPPADAGAGRLYARPACTVCREFVQAVARAVRDRGLSKYDAVVEAQAECWRSTESRLLGVQCGDFADVQRWLRAMDLVREGVDTSDVEAIDLELALSDAAPFCERVHLCGRPETDAPAGVNAAVARFRLRRSLEFTPKASRVFAQYVRALLAAAADALGVSRSRLELHLHRGDERFPEIAIRPARAGDRPIDNPHSEQAERARDLSPLALARNFRDMVAAKSPLLTGANKATNLIDMAHPVEVYALELHKEQARQQQQQQQQQQ